MKYSIYALAFPLILGACNNIGTPDETTDVDNEETGKITVQQVIAPTDKVDDNVDAKNAADFIATHPDAVVMDVRTPSEFAEGHIANAINVDFRADDFRAQLDVLDKDAHYVLHCKSGNRSGKSLEIMKEVGFTRVTHMDGGFDAWKAAELSITH